ncbi:hypothetical protein pdam_00024143, partial [Pocillopora damicornis]
WRPLNGTTSVAVGHPFDTIKTKMQAQHGFETEGMFKSFAKTVKSQGMRGLYRYIMYKSFLHVLKRETGNNPLVVLKTFRGCIPPLWGSGIYRSSQFAVFEAL